MRALVNSIIGILMMLYPLAVYFGISFLQPWNIAVIVCSLLIIRLIISPVQNKWNHNLLWIGIVFCMVAVWNNNLTTLRFYPVLMSFGLLIIFASSLLGSVPVVERLARLQHPDLPEQGVIYTRKVTQVWCVFFLLNGLMAFFTALWTSFAWWSLYNGFISYLLMASLMGIEYLIRIKTQPHVR